MTDDDQRKAERRRRMDELLASAEADGARRAEARAEADGAGSGPVAERKPATWWRSLLSVLIMLVIAALLFGAAASVTRFSGPDFGEARKVGTATVERCDRRGPVTLGGFGFYERCTLAVRWGTGPATVVIDRPGFMTGEKPGESFQIGENTGFRGTVSYSRPELPHRGWVGWVGFLIVLAGLLPLFAVVIFLRESVRRRR